MMKIAVTGGAGYIGSHAVKALIEQGHDVIIIDNLSTSDLSQCHPKARFYPISIHQTDALTTIFTDEAIDSVMHFAAFSLVQESVEDPLKYYHNNVEGTRSLVHAMIQAQVPNLIFSSTAAVYGDTDKQPIDETAPMHPKNPYGASKKAIEEMLYWTSQSANFNYIALRYFNVAGASSDGSIGENHNPETHLIPNIIQSILNDGQQFKLFGNDFPTEDGTAIRDYIHVEDLIDAHILALKHLIKTGKSDVFNLGSAKGYSVQNIIDVTEKVLNITLDVMHHPKRAGDPARLIADTKKAQSILKFTCQRDLESMIQSATDYYRNKGGNPCTKQ